MSVKKTLFVVSLSILLSGIALPESTGTGVYAQSADSHAALQKGYRAGYSDGYMAGYRDIIDSLSKDISRHTDYVKADRAYSKEYGSLQDYRDGYQQGFESGYSTGFDRRSFEATLPADLKSRGEKSSAGTKELMAAAKVAETQPPVAEPEEPAAKTAEETKPADETQAVAQTSEEPAPAIKTAEEPQAAAKTTDEPQAAAQTETEAETAVAASSATAQYQAPAGNPVVIIPRDIELILELQDDLNTEHSREGQKFTAKVASPSEIAGATIEGRVTKSRQAGRIKRRSELSLSFDRILLNDNRWSNFSATLVEVMPVKGDNISKVDSEGTAIGQSTFKRDALKVGGATGAGLIVGAIAGGPVGAAVGAGVGAAFGVGAVVIDRGKHVRLNRNQQMRVRTEYETQIR